MIGALQPTNAHPSRANSESRLFWREWSFLTGAGTLAALALLPATWTLVQRTAQQWHMSLAVFLALQILQSAIQVAILVAIGLFFARRTGLGAPIIERLLVDGKPGKPVQLILVPAIGFGIAAAVIVIALDRMVFARLLPGFSSLITQIAGWRGLLAAFEGGVLEELEMRLFMLSALAWLFGKVSHINDGLPGRGALWLATLATSVGFGLGHLPAVSLGKAITPLVVAREVVLNGIAGTIFGYLYWKRGLEAAMLSHFMADIVLHFIWPFIR